MAPTSKVSAFSGPNWGASASGDRVYTAFIERGDDDRLNGILRAKADVVIPGAVEAVHVVNDAGEDLLRIRATNKLAEPLAIDTLSWDLGGAIVGAACYLGLIPFDPDTVQFHGIVRRHMEIMTGAGIVAGLVYWLIAGRTAGAWREPPRPLPPPPPLPSQSPRP